MTEMFDRKSLIFRPSNNKIYLPPGPFNAKRKPWIRNVITLLSNGKSVQKKRPESATFDVPLFQCSSENKADMQATTFNRS